MTRDVHAWAFDLASLHEQVWSRLVRGIGDRHAPSRHPTLATISADGRPQARTVVLRAVDPRTRVLEIHTDPKSAKVAGLQVTPFAELHVWDPSAHLQTRLAAEVTIMTGAGIAATWARLPDVARSSYGVIPPPGRPIDGDLDYVRTADPAAFTVLQLRVSAIDVLHLGSDHRRARFERDRDWQGQWLVP